MRKIAIAVGIVVALFIIALFTIPLFINANSYRGEIQSQMQKRLDRPVSLGNMHLSLVPPSVRVDNVKIGENPAFGQGNFAIARQLYVSAKFWPLLTGNLQISSLDLRQPDINLIRNSQGVWNFQTIGQPAAQPSPSKPQQPPAQKPAPQQSAPQAGQKQAKPSQFELSLLKITDGKVTVVDRQKNQPPATYDHIDASLKNYAPGKPFSFSVAANLTQNGSQAIALSGTAGPTNQSNMVQTPFSGTARFKNVDISSLKRYLNSSALANMSGVITGTTDINNENGVLNSRGNLTIANGVVNRVTIGYPVTANYRVTDDLSNGLIKIEKGDIGLGQTPIAVSGTVNTKPTPSQIDMQLKASNASIGEAARLASAFGVAFAPGMNVTGRVNADVHAQGPTTKPAMNGTVSANDVVVSGDGLAQPVKVNAINLALTPQEIRSNPFTAVSGGTNVNGQFTLSQYTSPSPNVDATLKTANANIAELIGMAHAYGVSAAQGMSGSGIIDLDVRAAGPIKNTSALKFSGTGAMRNASIKPPNFTQPLMVRNANLNFNSNSAVISNLAASLGSTNASGNVTIRDFAAPNLQFTLNADKIDVSQLQRITSGQPQNQTSPAGAKTAAVSFWDFIPRADAQTRPATHSASAARSNLISKISGTGTITANSLQYDQLLITNLKSNVKIGRGIVNLTPIAGQLYGGQEVSQITANLLTTPMLVNVNTKLQNVQANQLLSAVSSIKDTIYGLLATSGAVRFSAASSQDIARTLNGNLALNLTNGHIANLDLLKQLGSIGQFAGVRQNTQALTNFVKMGGNFVINNGVAQTNNFKAQIEGGSLSAVGAVNLATQALNLRVTAVLDKSLSSQVGGTGVGGFMQTALANNHGELVIPVLVTGTFSQPHFAPDTQAIAQMKLKNLLPTTGNPSAGVSGLLNSVLGGKGAQGAQQGQQGGIGGILGSLAGQQHSQQQPPATAQPQQQPQQSQQQQPQQQQPANELNQVLNGVLGGQKK
jgi:uncharacterized protein involved in outer membrane biogenesis